MINEVLFSPDSLNVQLLHFFNNVQDPTLISLAIFMSKIAKFTFFPVYFFILAAYAKHKDMNIKLTLAPVLSAFVVYIVWVAGFKHLLHMPRPFIRLPGETFHVIDKVKDAEDPYASFPSGHAGFDMMMLVALWPFLNRAGKIIGTLIVLYVGFARMELGLHFPSDILFTWLLSFVITYITVHFSRKLFARRFAVS